MSWRSVWDWEDCPVWFIHTGLPQHEWKRRALHELFRKGHFWGESISETIPFQKEWNGTFGGQLWPACIGTNEPFWSTYCKYAQLPLGTHPMEHKLRRKAIKNAGAWGYLLTWIQIIEQAIHKKYPAVWIFDDDVRPKNDFPHSYTLFQQIKQSSSSNSWKILLWGASQQDWSHIQIHQAKQNKWYHPNQTTDGSFSIMIHHDIYQPLLHMLKRYITPVDTGCLTELYHIYYKDSYVIYPNQIMADVTSGEISAPIALEQISNRYHWHIPNFSFILYQKKYIIHGAKICVVFQNGTLLDQQQQQKLLSYMKTLPSWVEIYFGNNTQKNKDFVISVGKNNIRGVIVDFRELGDGFALYNYLL